MRLLLDTQILLWGAVEPERLPRAAISLIEDPQNGITFSALSLWEIAIKSARRRRDFDIDIVWFRRSLFENGYVELPLTGAHAARLANLPPIHRDPFDRMLIVQAAVEGLMLVTSDPTIAKYPGPIRLV